MAILLLRKRRTGVAPVISTILMVAIAVVLAAVLYLLVLPIMNPPPPPPASIVFQPQGWNGGNNSAVILSATGVQTIPASEVSYVVKDPEGATYFAGNEGEAKTTNSVTITIHYNDVDGGDRISAGDTVVIEVAPASAAALLDGGLFEMYHGGRQIANHQIA